MKGFISFLILLTTFAVVVSVACETEITIIRAMLIGLAGFIFAINWWVGFHFGRNS